MNTGFYELLGTRVAIHCEDTALGYEVHRLLQVFGVQVAPQRPLAFFSITSETGDKPLHKLSLAGEELVTGSPAAVLDRLMSQLNYVTLDNCAHLASHAGVVASGGEAIAFPGPSGSGKSTLTAACVAAGFEYVSDEAFCLRADGSVAAYPKPLSLWPEALQRLGLEVPEGRIRPMLLTADQIGGSVATEPLAPAHIVLREPIGTGGRAKLWPIARAETLMALMRNAFNHYKHRRAAFDNAARAAASAQAWMLSYDDPAEAAELLRRELVSPRTTARTAS